MTKITEIEEFIRRRMTVGSLRSTPWAEAGDLQRMLAHQLSILKILWYAEPDEVRFENLSDWITVIEVEVRTKLRAMEVFIQVRTMRTLTGHDVGVQTTTDPAGGGFVLHSTEATTNTNTRLNIDTVVRHKTLTLRAGDTGEQRFTLRPEDM